MVRRRLARYAAAADEPPHARLRNVGHVEAEPVGSRQHRLDGGRLCRFRPVGVPADGPARTVHRLEPSRVLCVDDHGEVGPREFAQQLGEPRT